MIGRIIGVSLVGLATLSVVALAALILIRSPKQPPQSAAADAGYSVGAAPVRISGEAGAWTVAAVAYVDRNGAVDVRAKVTDMQGRPAPEDLRMRGFLVMAGMPSEAMQVERESDGDYRVRGRASMAGAWRVRLVLPEGTVEIGVQVTGP